MKKALVRVRKNKLTDSIISLKTSSQIIVEAALTPTRSAWPLRSHMAFKRFCEKLLLDQLHGFSLLSLNSFFTHFLNQIHEKNPLILKKIHFRRSIFINQDEINHSKGNLGLKFQHNRTNF